MSPRVSGAYATDHARSVELGRAGADLARKVLRRGGTYVAKVFAGDMLDDLRRDLEREYARVRLTKPAASRGASSEMYLIALGFHVPASTGPARAKVREDDDAAPSSGRGPAVGAERTRGACHQRPGNGRRQGRL